MVHSLLAPLPRTTEIRWSPLKTCQMLKEILAFIRCNNILVDAQMDCVLLDAVCFCHKVRVVLPVKTYRHIKVCSTLRLVQWSKEDSRHIKERTGFPEEIYEYNTREKCQDIYI